VKPSGIVALLAIALGGCAQQAGLRAFDAAGRSPAEIVGATERPIDAARWEIRSGVVARPDRPPQQVSFHVCRRSACPSPTYAVVSYTPTGARVPDPAALRRIANEDMPARSEMNELVAAVRGDRAVPQLLASRVARFKGRPGIAVELRRHARAGVPDLYQAGAFAFTGAAMVSVQSFATNRAVARRNRDLILDGIEVRGAPAAAAAARRSAPHL
jgi:hypothetical protein